MENQTPQRIGEETSKAPRRETLDERLVAARVHDMKGDITVAVGPASILADATRNQFRHNGNPYAHIVRIYDRLINHSDDYLSSFRLDGREALQIRQESLGQIKDSIAFAEALGPFDKSSLHLSPEMKKLFSMLKRGHNRAKNTIAKLDAGNYEFEKASNLFAALHDQVYGDPRREAKEANLKSTLSPDLGKLEVNVADFEHIYLPLVKNALDAVAYGGNVAVRSYISGKGKTKKLILEVEDDGRGISHDLVKRVGQEGFTHGKKHGTGFGTSFVKSLIEVKYRGKFNVYSDGEGKGARVKVAIPLYKDAVSLPKNILN